MAGDEEVIRARIVAIDQRGMARWSAMFGQAHSGEWRFHIPDLGPGDELVIGVRPLNTDWVVTRIVNSGGKAVVKPEETDVEMWTPGTDRRRPDPIEPGDLVTDVVAFSADDGSGRTEKKRPCLVVRVSEGELCLRPIHSTGGTLHRTGMGLRLIDWKAANLANNSVVGGTDQFRFIEGPMNPARRIGRLSDRDFFRFFGHPRERPSSPSEKVSSDGD